MLFGHYIKFSNSVNTVIELLEANLLIQEGVLRRQ